ncbi:MAG: helix-turn-helix domain-containing protein [Halobacteriota archaeon]
MMAEDSEFITRLIGFGLSEKEAQLYLHVLKYGPRPPSLLAKSLKTYREDVYRTLTSLIDKGMVNPSLETPTVYAAVDLEVALDTALKKHESELREMGMRKQELLEISKQQSFRPSDEFATFRILKSIKDVMAVSTTLLSSIEHEFLVCVNEVAAAVASLYGINETAKELIDRGGKVRVTTDISYSMIELVRQLLEIGEEVRHYDRYSGIMFIVFDRKRSISAINANVKRMSLDEPLSALWSDDPTYANYLVSTFELLWEQSIPAAQRIEELLEQGPPRI